VGDAEAASEALKFNSYALMLVFTVDAKGFLVMASFDSNTVDMPHMQDVLNLLGKTVQFLCENNTAKLGDIINSRDEARMGQQQISSSGPKSLDSFPQSLGAFILPTQRL
jgi:hypothetical protein